MLEHHLAIDASTINLLSSIVIYERHLTAIQEVLLCL